MMSIPSDDEINLARAALRRRWEYLDFVCSRVIDKFREISLMHEIVIMPQNDVDFRAYVFFETNSDVVECQKNGICDAIVRCIYDELERAGRGKQGEMTVAFEWDSDENVKTNYQGSYYFRLH